MKVRSHNARPETQDLDVCAYELRAQDVGEGFLAGFAGVIDGFAGEGRDFKSSCGRHVENCACLRPVRSRV